MRKIGRSIRVFATIAGLWASLGAGARSAPAQRPGGQPGVKSSEARVGEPGLRLGKLDHPAGRLASLPLYFSAVQEKPVGSITAQIAIPVGSWIFHAVEAPKGAWWKVSSKERGEEMPKDSAKPSGFAIVEVSFSGGARPLQNGLIGYLNFQVSPPGSPVPAGLRVRRVEVASPSPGQSKPGAPGAPPPVPEQPTPAPSCFFFSH